jgi:hypothetical protein
MMGKAKPFSIYHFTFVIGGFKLEVQHGKTGAQRVGARTHRSVGRGMQNRERQRPGGVEHDSPMLITNLETAIGSAFNIIKALAVNATRSLALPVLHFSTH